MKNKLITVLLSIVLVFHTVPVYAVQQDTQQTDAGDGRQKAVTWLQSEETADGMWGNTSLCNDTCNVYAVLRYEKQQAESAYFEQWKTEEQSIDRKNTDELAHLIWATGDAAWIEEMFRHQNADRRPCATGIRRCGRRI